MSPNTKAGDAVGTRLEYILTFVVLYYNGPLWLVPFRHRRRLHSQLIREIAVVRRTVSELHRIKSLLKSNENVLHRVAPIDF